MTKLRDKALFSPSVRALTFLSVLPGAAMAGSATIEPGVEPFDAAQEEEAVGFRNGSLVAVPIPTSDPTLGSGLTVVAGYLFTLDEGSKPSGIGVAALRTSNGSEAYGLAANFAFNNNRWQIETLFANANINYDLFTSLGELPVRQDGRIIRAELSYGITPDFSIGFATRYLDTSISPGGPGFQIPPPFDRFLNMEIISPALVAEWDRRDDTIYPTQGFNLKAQVSHSYTLEGLTGDYSKGFVNYSHYFNPITNGVIAARASTCVASDDTPFFDQCSLGATDAFRGFPVTQFLNLRSVSMQVAYRHRLSNRFGVVAFAGAGQTGDSFSNLSAGGTHSAAGLGVRYRVSRKFPVDLSVDWTRNNDSEDQLYIYVGQRF